MIFSDDYDKSLWLMIKGDRRNRGRIVSFIKSIPYEFYLMIQEGLNEYERYKIDNEGISLKDREYKCFDNQMYNMMGELYSFNIDFREDILSITKSIYIMGAYYSNFNIKLRNVDSLLNDKNVGSICYSIDGIGNLNKVNYCVKDIGLTNVMVANSNKDLSRLCGIVKLDNNIDLNLDDINGRLVRIKKLNKRKDNKNV